MYDVTIEGITETLGALNRYDDIALAELHTAMSDSVGAIANAAEEGAPKWIGVLASSMKSRVMATGSTLIGEVYSNASNPIYPMVMEYGRRAGAKPPPTGAIANWVEDKFGDRSLAFVVARSIGRKGIKPHYFLRRAYERSKPLVAALFEAACKRIVAKLAVNP